MFSIDGDRVAAEKNENAGDAGPQVKGWMVTFVEKPNYVIERELSSVDVVVIRDVGPWDQYPTITNGVERVLAELWDSGELDSGRLVYYFDSEGDLAEIVHVDGEFCEFVPTSPEWLEAS